MEGGNLLEWLKKEGDNAQSKQLLRFCDGIAKGLYHLHEEGVVHRDLASRNVLLKESDEEGYEAVITDFGMSRIVSQEENNVYISSSRLGAAKWMAPESILNAVYSAKSDVWSYGCVMVEIYDRGRLYADGPDRVTIGMQVRDGKLKPTTPSKMPNELSTIANECFAFNSDQRPTMQTVIQKLRQANQQ